MTWAHPSVLWMLAGGVPALALLAAWSWRRRRGLITRFVPERLQQRLAPGLSRGRWLARQALWLGGLACLLLALARPRLGVAEVEVRQRGLDVLIAVDVSRSMLAPDGGGGATRLARARLAAMDLVRLGVSDRFGLIPFAGTAFLQTPLTFDDEAFRQGLELLDPEIIPQGGTALAAAIRAALAAADRREDNVRALVLFTDGENHEPGLEEAVQAAAQAGLRLFTVGVGTPQGEVIQLRDAEGRLTYLKDAAGNVVKSALNEPMLQQIAQATGGFYLPLQGPNPMAALYERGLAPLPRLDAGRRSLRQFHERFQWPLAVALLLLAGEALLPEQRRRRGRLRPAQRDHPSLRGVAAAAVLALLAFAPGAEGSAARALRDYRQGEFARAQAEYERLAGRRTNDLRLPFNAAAAAYKAGELEAAERGFHAATAAPDLALQKDAWRNLGDTAFLRGHEAPEPAETRRLWEEALRRYDTALKINPADTAAQNNREHVRRALAALPPPQPQQQQQQRQNQQGDDEPPEPQPGQDGQPPETGDQQDGTPPPDNPSDQPPRPQDSGQRQEGEQAPDESDASRDQSPPDQGREGREGDEGQGEEARDQAARGGEGTPGEPRELDREQALRLLDSARANEQLLPLERPRSRTPTLRDW